MTDLPDPTDFTDQDRRERVLAHVRSVADVDGCFTLADLYPVLDQVDRGCPWLLQQIRRLVESRTVEKVTAGPRTVYRLCAPLPSAPAGAADPVDVVVSSFGYRYLPDGPSAQLVLDVRPVALDPGPLPEFGERSGLDEQMRVHVLSSSPCAGFLLHLEGLALGLASGHGRAPVRIALGSGAGRHRSVVLAEELAFRLTRAGYRVRAEHLHLE